ncbi:MAG: glycosyltransferase family 2 protein, partial [Caulobacteraceae bacterium]|nr:glycosyltransferase family 2 protein [Caulobacter sp.]
LSVLTPFFRDDPTALMAALDREAGALAGAVELVLLDDAGGDPALSARAEAAVAHMRLPTRLIRLEANAGRAPGRNRLAAEARGRHLLFLDSDMAPDRPDFLQRWLELAREDVPAAVGGFTLDQARPAPGQRLHHALQLRAECLPAAARALQPEKYVFTSNLLVRRDVLAAEPFDEGFAGWGWEDVEWGVRVAARHGVRHVDNSASHLGLDSAAALLSKYEGSAANFGRLAARHPEMVARYPSHRVARWIRRLPARGALRAALRRLALDERAPLLARVFAAKTFRAAVYAEVVR